MGSLPVMIVEGITDKAAIEDLLDEPVQIVCTNGTVGYEQLQDLAEELAGEELYVLVDADEPGNKLRRQLKQVFAGATHLYTTRMYRQVATTPKEELARILDKAHFALKEPWSELVQHPAEGNRRQMKRRSK